MSTTTTSNSSFPTLFPNVPECVFYDNASCNIPFQTMFNFLNVTTLDGYFQLYCINPPDDSCSFGFCPNPDIAGPAVRISTYISTICLSIVMLYSTDDSDIVGAFYTQLLQMYSFLIAALIAIAARQLTQLHAMFVLFVVASPLSVYLTLHAVRWSFSRRDTGLKAVFKYDGEIEGRAGRFYWPLWRARLNRFLVLLTFPLWIIVFLITLLKRSTFNQAACTLSDADTGRMVLYSFLLGAFTRTKVVVSLVGIAAAAGLAVGWSVAFVRLKRSSTRRTTLSEKLMESKRRYPFILFYTCMFPFTLWIFTLENGAFFSNETFSPSYGQLLAIFIAVPPVLNCLYMWKRFRNWILRLTWVRFISDRMQGRSRRPRSVYNKPRRGTLEYLEYRRNEAQALEVTPYGVHDPRWSNLPPTKRD